jgi:hypothetical protein
VLLIACAEAGGASMVRFKLELTRWARSVILARPATHGLVGVRDVDEQIIDEALVKFDASLRLFHLHAEGMGLVIIVTTMTAATLARPGLGRRALLILLTAGGAGYPFGYLLWRAHPVAQSERAKTIAEYRLGSVRHRHDRRALVPRRARRVVDARAKTSVTGRAILAPAVLAALVVVAAPISPASA